MATPRPSPVRLVAPSRLAVGTSSVQGSNVACHGVIVKALCPGQTVYLGVAADVTTATGYPMGDGETLTLEVKNVNELWFIASAAAQAVSLVPFYYA